MYEKLTIINDWETKRQRWDETARLAAIQQPLKTLKTLPQIPGITAETKKFLTWKSFWYLWKHDEKRVIPRYILRKPLFHGIRLLKSLFKKKSFQREGDFFFYGLRSEEEFQSLLSSPTVLLVEGFSYCQKPLECPSGRFNDLCQNDPQSLICSQCFIGKCQQLTSKEDLIILQIPTIHYIGEKMLELQKLYPQRTLVFLITACELTLEMFGDLGNMAGLQGIGVRLDGRICNTFKAFELSEKGIKPGLTVVQPQTEERILRLLQLWSISRAGAKSSKRLGVQ